MSTEPYNFGPRKVIVTIAPTGGMALKSQVPQLPVTPEEIADDVVACWEAGASVAAIHARRPDGEATCDADTYSRINALIRERSDIVLNNSTGGGVTGDMVRELSDGLYELDFAERVKGLDGAGAEMCTLDAHTVTATHGDREILVTTTPQRSRTLAVEMQRRGIKPEWEVFSLSHILQDSSDLIRDGFDRAPYFFNIVLGGHRGFQGGLPYTPKILQSLVEYLPEGSIFNVSGIGPAQLPATVHALLLGGHVRVGLEDNLFLEKGRPATNLELTQRIVRIIRELGLEPATPSEAREMMGLTPLVGHAG